jgi:hypothetical protein
MYALPRKRLTSCSLLQNMALIMYGEVSMKRNVLVLVFLLIAFSVLSAQERWPQPIDVVNSTYYDLAGYSHDNEMTDSQGNTYVFIKEFLPDGTRIFLQKFSQSWQPLWQEPLYLNIYEPFDMIETSDGNLIFAAQLPMQSYGFPCALFKINPAGQHLWSNQGIVLPSTGFFYEICSLAPDVVGGAYLIYSHFYNASGGDWRYQRISSTGLLSPSPALILGEFDDYPGDPQIHRLPDDKVVVTLSFNDESSVICFNGQNQIIWRKDHSGNAKSVTSSEGITYTTYIQSDRREVFKYDQFGSELWLQPLYLTPGPWSYDMSMEIAPTDDSFFLYWKNNLATYMLARISSEAEILWIRQGPFNSEYDPDLVPDSQGGLFIYDQKLSNTYDSLCVQHLDPQGQETIVPMCEFPIAGCYNELKYSGRLIGNELRLIFGFNIDYINSIKVQTVSFTGELGYGQAGIDLAAGRKIVTKYHTLGQMGDKAVVVWGQRDSNGTNFWLKYQIYNAEGSTQYTEPQLLTSAAVYVGFVRLYENPGQGVQIVWLESSFIGQNSTLKLQIISPDGTQILEPSGRNLITGIGYNSNAGLKCQTGFWDGKLYAANSNGGQIRLWCFLDGVSQWDSQGIVIANPDPEIPGGNKLIYLKDNYLVWNVGYNTSEPSVRLKCTRFDSIGLPAEGFSLDGLPVAILNPSDWGIGGSGANSWGNRLFVQFSHTTPYWDETNEVWEFNYSPTAQVINPDGSYAWGDFGLAGIQTEETITSGDQLYALVPILNNEYYFDIIKLNLNGTIAWTHRITETDVRYYFHVFNKVDNDNFVLSYLKRAYESRNYMYRLQFDYFNAEGEFTPPANDLLNSYSSNLTTLQQVVAQNSVYVLAALEGGQLCQLFRTQTTSAVSDHGSPTNPMVLSIENVRPNPFNPQTTIQYWLRNSGKLTLDIYNSKGQSVRSLINEDIESGRHLAVWDGKDCNGDTVASGVYFLRLNQDKHSESRKLLLMK